MLRQIQKFEEKNVFTPLQQYRIEALFTALVSIPGQSEKSHAIELIDFLEQNFEFEAIAYAVALASCHKRAFGETPGTQELLDWAREQLSDYGFNTAANFYLKN